MVFDEHLGYDTDEWEECPEPEHFLVFSGFTRYLLTFAAIAFVYYFFKLLDEKNKKESKLNQEDHVEDERRMSQTSVEQVLAAASNKLSNVNQQVQHVPKSVEELVHEADTYLRKQAQSVQKSVQHIAEQAVSQFPILEVDLNNGCPDDDNKKSFENLISFVNDHIQETENLDLSPTSRDSTQFEQIISTDREHPFSHDFEHVPPHLKRAAEHYYAQQQPPPIPQHQGHQGLVKPTPISSIDQKLLQEFDVYDIPADQRNQIRNSPHKQLFQHGTFQQHLRPQIQQQQHHYVDISPLSTDCRSLIPEQQMAGAFQPVAQTLHREKRLSEQ
uniref:Uncharacterized protein n=1 Tax=Caenorhabditis tropicalis TaxID=1561998 RepID=A0A1I7TYY5_9PELO